MAVAANVFFDSLQKLPLLTETQRAQLLALQDQFPDLESLSEELLRRGWLTRFQIDYLLQGKGNELILDQYVLIDLLGQGGMGSVFKAQQQRMERIVALKLILADYLRSPGAVERFQREARLAAKLSHPNVVSVFDTNVINGVHFLVMEYIDGTDLAGVLRQRGIPTVGEACEYIRQAALGLQHAHECDLVHRDIKPSNLLLTKKGVVKIMDLGLARPAHRADAAATEGLSNTGGGMVGTLDYMAPEQALDSRRVDIRADIYALGCTLYHLLAGRVPFPGGTLTEKLLAHQLEEPEPIEKLRPALPKALVKVLRTMLAKRPEKRYQTPAEVVEALAPFATPISSAPTLSSTNLLESAPPTDTLEERSRRSLATLLSLSPGWWLPRHPRRGVLLGGLALVVLLVGVGFTVLFAHRLASPPQTAALSTEDSDTPANLLVLELGEGVKLELVPIKAGSFRMGSPVTEMQANADEKPQHEVTISQDFYLGRYPVTQEQYLKVVGKNPSYFSRTGGGQALLAGVNTDRFPVEEVTWLDATKFCQRLSRLTQRNVQLPTEAQWEYACRAGTTSRFSCGDVLDVRRANFNYGVGRTSAVGSYPKNPWGLSDMAGNVWQWCADAPQRYTSDPCKDPFGTDSGVRVMRGGSWLNDSRSCRAACRVQNEPSYSTNTLGFRVVVRPD